MYKREDIKPALLRPSMYTGDKNGRSDVDYLADAVVEYLNAKVLLTKRNMEDFNL